MVHVSFGHWWLNFPKYLKEVQVSLCHLFRERGGCLWLPPLYICICVTSIWLTYNIGYLKSICCIHISIYVFYILYSIFYIYILYLYSISHNTDGQDCFLRLRSMAMVYFLNWRSTALEWCGNFLLLNQWLWIFLKWVGGN